MTFTITSRFGDINSVRNNIPHTGVDIAMPEGTELKSVVEGTISKVIENHHSLGNAIYVKDAEGKEYIYGHLSEITVDIGDRVNTSDVIALSGNTGNSTGPHLHFAIKENGEYVDPEIEMAQGVELLSEMDGSGIMENPISGYFTAKVGEGWEVIRDKLAEFFVFLSESMQTGSNSFLAEMMDFVLYTPLLADNEIIMYIWEIVRLIAFVLIGLIIAWEGFKTHISTDNVIKSVEFKELLIRMIYGIILAVFSLDIIDLMITFNNVLVDTVSGAFPMSIEETLSVNGVFSFIMVTALVVVQLVLGVKLLLQYWMRIAEIWLMAVLGPIVYVLWINPSTRLSGILSQWVSRLTTTIFTTFVWALIIAIYSGMVSMIASAGMLTGFATLGPIAGICLSIAMLLVMIGTPSFLKGFLDNQPDALQLLKSTYTNVKNSTPIGVSKKAAGWLLNRK